MKFYILFVHLFLLQGTVAFAQTPPLLSDFPSNEGSGEAIGLYYLMGIPEKNLRVAVNRFNTDYAKRTLYLEASFKIAKEIDKGMNDAITRYNNLKSRNNSLTLFSYSTKKKNRKSLETIDKMLDNMKREVDKQDKLNVILGEKINLYVGTMESLSKIHRLMDVVEDNIDNTTLFRRLFY